MTDSNANKENENQGNSEIIDNKEMEEECDNIINEKEFKTKYMKLQKQWLEGHRNEKDFNSEECKKYGQHSYILQYLLNNSIDNEEIVFHPTYSYSYTNYEKDCILPLMDEEKLKETQEKFQCHIDRLETKILKRIKEKQSFADNQESNEDKEERGWVVPKYCIPIRTDIRKFDFCSLAVQQKKLSGRLFDAIMMDPPWQLATANPTRGVAIGYSQLEDNIISGIPIQKLQDNGLLFVWVINAKYRLALTLFKKWGYTMIGDIGWVKQTVNRRIANGHGYYLQHAKETCLIGLKGDLNKISSLNNKKIKGICSDIIYSERRGQSQKPEEVYQYIEQLIPNGFYMEIFGRRNNLRNGWLTIGNEL